ncbi:MAG: DNA polymerase/3'-5' exonuclease PolX [Candidatus Gracilibacteria bacterium]|jgi:DNA polymerase (family 10)|nr:DNA polymerase/3'-5' exonuclease PolX [Candidatus Gracilibacteria bacterium]
MFSNKQIAEVFYEMADVLDIKGDNPFRINALRRGALIVEGFSREFSEMYKEDPNSLNNIPGLGEGLRSKAVELIKTGKCKEHIEMLKGFPEGLIDMLRLRGVGPKKVKLFYEKLGIKDIKSLKKACEKGEIAGLPKMGKKSQTEILNAISETQLFSQKRFLIDSALFDAESLIEYLKDSSVLKHIQYAGSLRRFQDTIGDIDILATIKGHDTSLLMNHYLGYPKIFKILSKGDTKSSVILLSGIQVDLRVVEDKSFGAALHYFTGDKQHNIKIRDLAKKKGLKISEYGVFDGEKMVGGVKEQDIFDAVGLPYIPPELRRNDGEIEYALSNGGIPELIQLSDLRGDLHVHSTYSDGKYSMMEMAEACFKLGLKYMAFADHSSLIPVTGGMDEVKIQKQWKEINEINKKFEGLFHVFKSCEVDIRKDGSLDFSDEILSKLDFAIASVHMRYKELNRETQTKRVISAISNPFVKILAHPTGRKINERPEIDMDMEAIVKACVDNDVALEINSNPMRLDLYDKLIVMAKDLGAKFSIDSDSHFPNDFDYLKFGVGMARRGWLEASHVINTLPLEKFKSILKKNFNN